MGLSNYLEGSPESVEITYSPAESEGLGIRVGRAHAGVNTRFSPAELPELFRNTDFDLIIFRHPSNEIQVNSYLAKSGLVSWQADTLIYASKKIATEADCDERGVEMTLEPVRVYGIDPELEEIMTLTFDDYPNHYASNPSFEPLGAAPYVDWLRRDLEEGRQKCWKLRNEKSQNAGFIACAFDGDRMEITVGGFKPEFQGRGYYEQMLIIMSHVALAARCPEIAIPTQSGNIGVLRTWSRQGILNVLSINTVYVELGN